jgi:hypothetical protein
MMEKLDSKFISANELSEKKGISWPQAEKYLQSLTAQGIVDTRTKRIAITYYRPDPIDLSGFLLGPLLFVKDLATAFIESLAGWSLVCSRCFFHASVLPPLLPPPPVLCPNCFAPAYVQYVPLMA